jgi:hypothetical protein
MQFRTKTAAVLLSVATLTACGSTPIDNTAVGGTLSPDRVKQVLGHLFDGVQTVHVDYVAVKDPTATAAADVVIGPPVQASITIRSTSDPSQSGSIVIKDDKVYLTQPSLKGKWMIASSSQDGVSETPAVGQGQFERAYLGPYTSGTYKGTETINGISTRQYVLTAALPASASPSAKPQVITVATVWIDGSGRLIRYTYSPTGDGQWETATYSQWGESVTVNAPKSTVILDGTM